MPIDRRGRAIVIVRWICLGLAAAAFLGAGGAKLAGVPDLVKLFDAIGFGQWFRCFAAVCEIGGAILLLVPRTVPLGAALLFCVCVGALITHAPFGWELRACNHSHAFGSHRRLARANSA